MKKLSYGELNDALEALTEAEFSKFLSNEVAKEQFLASHGWTYAEFKQATVDFWTNAEYEDGTPYFDSDENI